MNVGMSARRKIMWEFDEGEWEKERREEGEVKGREEEAIEERRCSERSMPIMQELGEAFEKDLRVERPLPQ